LSCGIEPQALHLDGKFYDFELMQLDFSGSNRQAKSTSDFRIHD
jgi:hypothetical protein